MIYRSCVNRSSPARGSSRRGRRRLWIVLAAGAIALGACRRAGERLRIATTTSVEASGLLGALLPAFEKSSGIPVETIAVGSGKALKLAENGDVDAVLSHAPDLEEAFVRSGFGRERRVVLENDFVIVGPPEDPAGVRGCRSAASAFARIAASGAGFVSRGDESGTHQKEKQLWRAAGASPAAGYVSAGLGMGEVLLLADEKRAYTLVDRATLAAFRRRIELAELFEGDPALRNPYSVIAVNPMRHPHVHSSAAAAFTDWLASAEGQAAIAAFAIEGEHPFRPALRP
jgi:tungstate transport system substrate-binding protein